MHRPETESFQTWTQKELILIPIVIMETYDMHARAQIWYGNLLNEKKKLHQCQLRR